MFVFHIKDILMMMIMSLIIKHEKPIFGTNAAVSVKAHWRKLPPVLHTLKANNCSIHKAKYWDEWTSMYIKTPPSIVAKDVYDMLSSVQEGTSETTLYSCGLPFNTCIHIYNICASPYTVLDFGCLDRTGLFCEIIELMSKYDVEIKGAYINTIGSIVSNIFYITYKNERLSDPYIEYLRNCLEIDVKHRVGDSY